MKIAKLLNPFYVYRRGFVELEYLMLRHGLRASLNYQKLAALKDKHQGKRAFIIGNGSSLRISDLDRLTGEITFACNKIYLAFDQTQWRPTYYVAGDRLFFMQTWFYLRFSYPIFVGIKKDQRLDRWLFNCCCCYIILGKS